MKEISRSGKISSAIAGLLLFAGVVILGVFALAFSNIADPTFLIEEYQFLTMMFLLVIGILDLISGIILLK